MADPPAEAEAERREFQRQEIQSLVVVPMVCRGSTHQVPARSAATWFDEGTPWAVFTVEDIRQNVDVEDYIQARGP